VLAEFVAEYDFKQTVATPKEDLLGIEQQMPTKGIIKLDAMTQLIDTVNKNRIIKLSNCKRSPIYIKDKELQFVDELLESYPAQQVSKLHFLCSAGKHSGVYFVPFLPIRASWRQ